MQEREILFRGKTYDGKWEQGDLRHGGYVHNDSETYIMRADYALHNIPVDPKTVGQYTGSTDKNGVKIFEGDIIKHHFGEDYGVVKFGEYSQPSDDEFTKHIGFYVDWLTGENKDILRKDLGYWANIDSYDILVGNTHDNPKVLEED